MTINLAPPNTTLTINGTDYSAYLREVTGSYSAISESGLVVKTGSAVLAINPIGWPRLITDFSIGSRVEITQNNQSIQVMGVSFIEHCSRDEREDYLTITLSCQLGLANNAGPGDLGICVNLNIGITAGNAVSQLLSRAGLSAIIPFTGPRIKEPITLGSGESLIRKAAEICFANGYFLYEANDGVVRVKSYETNGTPLFARDRFQLIRAVEDYDGSLPPTTVEVETASLEYLDDEDNYFLVDYTQFGRIETTYEVNRDSRTITSTQREYQVAREAVPEDLRGNRILFGEALVRETYTIEKYEQEKGGFNQTAATWGDCIKADEGRLLQRTTWTNEIKAEALAEYYRIGLAIDIEPESLLGMIETERTVETWTYDLPPMPLPKRVNVMGNSSLSTSSRASESVTQIVNRYQPEGKLLPFTADPKFGRDNEQSNYIGNPSTPIQISSSYSKWKPQKNRQIWLSRVATYEAEIIKNPQGISTSALNTEISLSNVVNSAKKLSRVLIDNGRDQPSIQRFPPKNAPVVRPIVYYKNYSLVGRYRKKLSYSVNPQYASNAGQLVNYMGTIAWGQYYGWIIAGRVDFDNVLAPLSVLRVDSKIFAVDSLSITLNSKEMFYAYKGIYLRNTDGQPAVMDALSLEESNDLEASPVTIFGILTSAGEYICL